MQPQLKILAVLLLATVAYSGSLALAQTSDAPAIQADDPAAKTANDKTPNTVDLIIRNGTLIDGTGAPSMQADVAIDAGRIVAVGRLTDMTAKETIDARNRVVCPGFIDLHSHADGGILKFRAAENYIRQGVTTLVCGNCGSSPVNVAEFFDKLRDGGTGPNIALLIGHGSVRREVIGTSKAPPTAEQLLRMKRLVREAMQAGAVGMSTGLTYSPSAYGTTEEITELAEELAPFNGFYATHIRDEGTKVFEALDEAFKIGRDAGVPVHISHHKISAASVFGLTRLTLQRIDEARAAGLDVTLDQYPYGAGSGGFSFYVPQASLAGGMDAYRRRIADPSERAEIVADVEDVFVRKLFEAGQNPDNADHTAAALARVQIARAPEDKDLTGKNLAEILRTRNIPVTVHNGAELLVDQVARDTVGINHTIDDRPGGDVDRVMQYAITSIASDGSVFEFGKDNPHPRSYGCYPRVLGHYVRERKVLKLEDAIHKMTQLPARRLGWQDRGVIAQGQWADLVVFDPNTIADKATFLEPHQHSVGIDHVLVRGRFVLTSGQMTGNLPGRPLPEKEDTRLGLFGGEAPVVVIKTSYPGANARVVLNTVARPIEQQVSGVEKMLHMTSLCTKNGACTMHIAFKAGIERQLALVLVQNRVALAGPVLPKEVQNRGVVVELEPAKNRPSKVVSIALVLVDQEGTEATLREFATRVLQRLTDGGAIIKPESVDDKIENGLPNPASIFRIDEHPALLISGSPPDGKTASQTASHCVQLAETIKAERHEAKSIKILNLTAK